MQKKSKIALEISLWIMAVIILAFLVLNSFYDKKGTNYSFFLDDANGLEVGSPVDVLGVRSGYIKEIKLLKDKVKLTFELVKGEVKFPLCTQLKVLSSSLGGARFLDIEPPEAGYHCGEQQFVGISVPRPTKKNIEKLTDAIILGSLSALSVFGEGENPQQDIEVRAEFVAQSTKDLKELNHRVSKLSDNADDILLPIRKINQSVMRLNEEVNKN